MAIQCERLPTKYKISLTEQLDLQEQRTQATSACALTRLFPCQYTNLITQSYLGHTLDLSLDSTHFGKSLCRMRPKDYKPLEGRQPEMIACAKASRTSQHTVSKVQGPRKGHKNEGSPPKAPNTIKKRLKRYHLFYMLLFFYKHSEDHHLPIFISHGIK